MHPLHIDAERLWNTLVETAEIGGSLDGGIRRLTLSEPDRLIRDWFFHRVEAMNCTVSIDEVGNMFALRPGKIQDAPAIAIGSHLDTQPTGGRFDGVLGVLAGLEIFQTLNDANYLTDHPLLLVNWTNEEGARFSPTMLGSGVHSGVFTRDYADGRVDADGIYFRDALDAIGYRGSTPPGLTKFKAMFELHIEQGPILEREAKDIGVVLGVQGMRWYDVLLTGREAHAGSTPMNNRFDALLDAARIILGIRQIATKFDGVATVGELKIANASRNVVPGQVRFSVDLRHFNGRILDEMEDSLRALVAETELTTALENVFKSASVAFDETCLATVRNVALDAGLSVMDIVSGASHDSVYISRICPTAMIFVPSKDGLSHNPAEFSSEQQCARGAQTLLQTVLSYDSTR